MDADAEGSESLEFEEDEIEKRIGEIEEDEKRMDEIEKGEGQ